MRREIRLILYDSKHHIWIDIIDKKMVIGMVHITTCNIAIYKFMLKKSSQVQLQSRL